MKEKQQDLLISVIIPVFNGERYIQECLDSIICQTYKNFEVMVVDDGSSDHTPDLVRACAGRDARIRLFAQENQGPAVARNMGMSHASGDYIAFLDADDFWADERCLETICNTLAEIPCDVLGTIFILDYEGKRERTELHLEYFAESNEGQWISFSEEQKIFNFTSYLYRRDFLESHQIRFPALCYFEDPPFLFNALSAAGKYYIIPLEWYCYRREHKENYRINKRQQSDYIAGMLQIARKAGALSYDKIIEFQKDLLKGYAFDLTEQLLDGNLEILFSMVDLLKLLGKNPEENQDVQFVKEAVAEYAKVYMASMERMQKEVQSRLAEADRIVIYGAGKYGKSVLNSIGFGCGRRADIYFAMTKEPAEEEIYGRPVRKIDELLQNQNEKILVIVAIREVPPEMMEVLKSYHIENYMVIDARNLKMFERSFSLGKW